MMMMDMPKMMMYFHGNTSDRLLFKPFQPESGGQYFLALLALFVLTMVKEYLFFYRRRMVRAAAGVVNSPLANKDGLASSAGYAPPAGEARGSRHLLDSLIYTLNLSIGYLLMLAVMTYNIGYCLTVVLTSGLGHYIFGRVSDAVAEVNEPEAECCDQV